MLRILDLLLAPPFFLIVVGTVVVTVGVVLAVVWALGRLGGHINSNETAFFLGFLIAGFLGAVWYIAAEFSGGASGLLGASAERWTSKELRQLGPEWRCYHNVPFVDGVRGSSWEVDVDHVAIGPYGVLAVESKYRSAPVDLANYRLTSWLRDVVRQAEDNAARIKGLLLRDAPDVPVRPVVIVWGRLVKPPLEPVRRIGTVRVEHGAKSDTWRPLIMSRQIVDQERLDVAAAKVANHVARSRSNTAHSE